MTEQAKQLPYRGPWAHDTERSGPNGDVPVLWISETRPAQPGWHPATDDEYAAYERYWCEVCPCCGKERGDHLDDERRAHSF